MNDIENRLLEIANGLADNDRQVLVKAVTLINTLNSRIQEFREVNARLRRENEALSLDIHFYDKQGLK